MATKMAQEERLAGILCRYGGRVAWSRLSAEARRRRQPGVAPAWVWRPGWRGVILQRLAMAPGGRRIMCSNMTFKYVDYTEYRLPMN